MGDYKRLIRCLAAKYEYCLSAVYALLEPMVRLSEKHFRTFVTLGTGGKWTLSEVIVQAVKMFSQITFRFSSRCFNSAAGNPVSRHGWDFGILYVRRYTSRSPRVHLTNLTFWRVLQSSSVATNHD